MGLSERAAAVDLDVMPGAGDPANYSLPQQPLHRCMLPGAAAFSTLRRVTNPHDCAVGGVRFLGTSGQNVDDVFRCVGWGGLWGGCRGAVGFVVRTFVFMLSLSGAAGKLPAAAVSAAPCVPRHAHAHTRTRHTPLHRYSDIEDRAAILERLLRWRHLAPTAPDTLAAYPYFDEDPFILTATPHVLFAGGQPAFATALVREEAGEAGGGGGDATVVRVVAVPNFCATGCVVLVNLRNLACHPVYFDAEF